MDESVNVPIPPPMPSEPSQAGPSLPLELTVSIERARKLGARNYDGIGDHEKAWSWLEGNERVGVQCDGMLR